MVVHGLVEQFEPRTVAALAVPPAARLLADSAGHALERKLELPDRAALFALKKGHREIETGASLHRADREGSATWKLTFMSTAPGSLFFAIA